MKAESAETEGITNAILRRLVADQAAGTVSSIETYEELWPDHREIVQHVFHERPAGLAAPEEEAGRQFASYVLERELGRGGQGVVWLARDVRLDRPVALKVLTGLHGADARLLERFRREARVASRLDHPGICTIYEFGHDGGVPFIAMRFLEGETLAQKLDAHAWGTGSAPLDLRGAARGTAAAERAESTGDSTSTRDRLRTLLRCFQIIGDALHVAHESGIVHRDIKPGNVMIDPQGHPVLLDFGLARDARDERGTLTLTGDVLGTPVYMAPEQVSPKKHGIDRRTDVFSLASTLYECLTGARPFSSPTREGLYHEILSENPVPPSRRVPKLPRELDIVLATALEKEPDRRYQSTRDLAEDLRRVRENEPILARRPGPAVRTLRWSQRNPALAALIFVLAAGVITALLLLSSERLARREAQSNLDAWRRMADLQVLRELQAQDAALWPAWPENIVAMQAWIGRAERLIARLPQHRATLEALRETALPLTREGVEEDRRTHPAWPEVTEVERQLDIIRYRLKWLEGRSEEPLPVLRERNEVELARYERRLIQLTEALGERRTWRLEDDADQWSHSVMDELVRGIQDVAAEPGLLAAMRRRVRDAESIGKDLETHAADWEVVRSDLADDPRFAGVDLSPQVALIPIGKDPDSQLWEFAHLGSGVPVGRGADGRLELVEASGLVFVLVPGGTFLMGSQGMDPSQPNFDPTSRLDSYPVHEVEVPAFFVSKYEMTQSQWTHVAGENPSTLPPDYVGLGRLGPFFHPNNPVETVSWRAARSLVSRLRLELPQESWWEYACRAGTQTPYWTGAELASLKGAANLADEEVRETARRNMNRDGLKGFDDGYEGHAPVGQYRPNAFGLHDMVGNVWEWCEDPYSAYPGASRLDRVRTNARVLRGGSFLSRLRFASSAVRFWGSPDHRDNAIGLRPIRRILP